MTCATCPRQLSPRNTSGYCRACVLHIPETKARRLAALKDWGRGGAAAEVCRKAGKARWAPQLAWCPPEHRAEYHRWVKQGIPAAEAKRIMLEQIKRDRTRPKTFEERLALVEAGKASVAVKADLSRRDYNFSLTGGSLP